ncbi:helicase associated domain-containing protein [Streptomyces sp. WG5]|uniref:helicase associated domain-containing protein n=1 Tax=Streptomyces sp. WG5 TaxID=3417648 RepID=UPI003CF296BD
MTIDGDDIGHWLQRQRRGWRLLSTEQQAGLSGIGVKPAQTPLPASAARGAAKGSKAQQAFHRGLAALAQWIEREGQRTVPRGAVVEIPTEGEAAPTPVRLGVWLSNTRARRDRLTAEQLNALRKLGVEWA